MSDPVRILIVDDDPSILSLLEEVFGSSPDLNVTAKADSQVAYDLLAKERYDLLITDLMMPQVDGLMLLEHAISLNPDILVVIITGYASLETTLEAIHAGVYDYITKPFRLEEFRLLVNNAAARIRLMHDIRRLHIEKRESLARNEELEERCNSQQEELERLREELGRREDLVAQTGVSAGEGSPQAQISTYQSMLETAEERYRRQIQDLEELFSSGRLTSDEFEVARQNLKTKI